MLEEEGIKTRWTALRIARLGFLIGLGWEARRVAADPLIVSTANNVHRQAQRFGLAFRDVPPSQLKLTPETAAFFETAAGQRSLTRETLIKLLLELIADGGAALLDNIIDDGVTTTTGTRARPRRRH